MLIGEVVMAWLSYGLQLGAGCVDLCDLDSIFLCDVVCRAVVHFPALIDDKKPYAIYLDVLCIRTGDDFQRNFATGLANSRVVCFFMSAGTLEDMVALATTDCVDNVLVEWNMALMLVSMKEYEYVQRIVPVFLGDFKDIKEAMEASCRKWVSKLSNDKAIELIRSLNIQLTPEMEREWRNMGVKQLVEKVFAFQGIFQCGEGDVGEVSSVLFA